MKNLLSVRTDKKLTDTFLIEKTGKNLEEWYRFMDRFSSLGLNEKELFRLIHDNFKIGSWLENAIISSYTNQKQKKRMNIPVEDLKIQNSIELIVPQTTLINLWSDRKLRNYWFPAVSFTIVRENPKKLIQLLWCDSVSIVNIRFLKIDKSKSRIEIIHYNLPDSKAASEMDAFWKKVLQTLSETITSDLFHTIILDI
jgi:hypothetical protein